MKNKAETHKSKIIDEILDAISPAEAKRIENKMLLAAKIEDAIHAKGWKKKDLANVLNKRPSEITKWLSGTHNFTTDTLWDIENVLDMKLINLEEKYAKQFTHYQVEVEQEAEVNEPANWYFNNLHFSNKKFSFQIKKPIKLHTQKSVDINYG